MTKNNIDFKKLDVPLSFRVPKELHKKYKGLSSHERKRIQFLLVEWLKKKLE